MGKLLEAECDIFVAIKMNEDLINKKKNVTISQKEELNILNENALRDKHKEIEKKLRKNKKTLQYNNSKSYSGYFGRLNQTNNSSADCPVRLRWVFVFFHYYYYVIN
jgi:hypothetical protein